MNAEFESKATSFTLILEQMRGRQSTKKCLRMSANTPVVNLTSLANWVDFLL